MKLLKFDDSYVNIEKIEIIDIDDDDDDGENFIIRIRVISGWLIESFNDKNYRDARFEEILLFLTEGIWQTRE